MPVLMIIWQQGKPRSEGTGAVTTCSGCGVWTGPTTDVGGAQHRPHCPRHQGMRLVVELRLTPTEQSVLWSLAALGGIAASEVLLTRCGGSRQEALAFLRLAKRIDLVGWHARCDEWVLTRRGSDVAKEVASLNVESLGSGAVPDES